MVDFTVTKANVLASGQATTERGIAGVTITAGQSVYKEAATGLFKLQDVDSATVEARSFYGIALHDTLANAPLVVVRADPSFTPGFTSTVGARVYGSATAGGIAPEADVTTGKMVSLLGIMTTTTKMILNPVNSGVLVP